MAVQAFERVQILGFSEVKKSVLEKLQEQEIIHLEAPSVESISYQDESFLKDLERVVKTLTDLEEKKFLQGVFPEPLFLAKDEFKKLEPANLTRISKGILKLITQKETLLLKIRQLEEIIHEFAPFMFLNLTLNDLTTKHFSSLVIRVSQKEKKRFLDLESAYPKIIGSYGKEQIVFLLIRKENEAEVVGFLKKAQIQILELPTSRWRNFSDKTPTQIIEGINTEILKIKEEVETVNEKIRDYLPYREKLLLLYDFLLNENFKDRVGGSFLATKRLFFLDGWVPKERKSQLQILFKEFKDKIYIRLRPPKKGELSPTKLKNKRMIAPFQIIVDMYGPPHPTSLDPTIYLAPFFFLFVGICISDAGYGVILSILAAYILKKKRLTKGAKNFFRLLLYLGISTSLVGLVLGSMLGFDLPTKKIDIVSSPLKFLIFCFILGYIQVMVGVILKLYLECKARSQKALSTLGWLVLLISLPLFFISKLTVFKFLIIAGVGLVALFSSESKNILARFGIGLYELYGITRYFSDVLSYSRLLALGMATGVIAMVVNLLARQVIGVPFIGIILAGLIFLGGHTFNLLINLLSGFIHSARLQFVEFFSKFFVLGGKFFEPLKIKTKYVRVVENGELKV
jgi:V/A-type H+-transporting ATPase subunit I